MSIYDIDYNTKAVEWLPPDKRRPKMVGFIRALFSEIQYLALKILTYYRLGTIYTPYASGGTYSAGTLVEHKQVVYESLMDNNSSTPPSTGWAVYLPSFIGVDNRVKFNGIKLTLEYALNARFHTAYRQPLLTDPLYPHVSDIYITSTPYTIRGFNVGYSTGSAVGRTHSTGNVGTQLPFYQPYMFNIMVPAYVYAQLNAQGGAVAEITAFVTPLCPAGTTFSITQY